MKKILVINAGSSGHKSCLYEVPTSAPVAPPVPLWQTQIDRQQTPPLLIATGAGQTVKINLSDDLTEEIEQMLSTLSQGKTAVLSDVKEIAAVGHRVVHGGSDYTQAVWIDEDVKAAIARLTPLAPAHNPIALEGISSIEQLWQDIPQFAAFDTAFHSQMPQTAALYPVPQDWIDQGIRRYGFHGISHQYCAHRAAELLGQPLDSLRLVIAHLGNGCSLAAVKNGHSIDTTMGFTPLDGLMMGTRSGSIDPGIFLYLMREQGYTVEQLDHLLNKCSGLKGISGISGDMRVLEEAIAAHNPKAQLAVDMYLHRLRAGIAAMTASLGGLDALIFTGGVSEHTPRIRAETCKALAFLGIELSEEKNAQIKGDQRDRKISPDQAKVSVFVVSTQEEWQIAREYWQLLG
jgi:acetate kinase